MKKFKNMKTGLVWFVTNDDLINRLEKDPDHEEIKVKRGRPKKEEVQEDE